jgi:DNA polymerase-1
VARYPRGFVRLVLIDAANCLYRAFFALPPLRASDGFPTNALHGFTQMLRKVLREEQPTAVAVVFDPPGGSFRRELYAGYKAKRDAQPEDLTAQFPVARELVEAAGIPLLEVPGFEADDVIASLVRHAPEGTEVVIVSSDKDLMQLVTEQVSLLDTMKDRRIGPADVEKRFGVPPERLLDLRALVGDPSDNIPGVKGIGEKGAAKLINEFETLEALLERAGEVSGKRAREALLEQADEARLSKRLATLRTDVPGCEDPGKLAPGAGDPAALRALYERLELKRMLEALDRDAAGGSEVPARADAGGGVVTDVASDGASLEKLIGELARQESLVLACVGLEGPGGLPPSPVGIAFARGEDRATYVSLGAELAAGDAIEALAPLLGSGGGGVPWMSRDTKRLQTLFAEHGHELALPATDVELAGFLLDSSRPATTAALAGQLLGRAVRPFEEVAGRGAKAVPPEEMPVALAAQWAGEEACALAALAIELGARLEKDGLRELYEDIELPLTAVLSSMEREGVRVDEAALGRLAEEFGAKLADLEAEIHRLAGGPFQINSPKQLQVVLFEKLGLTPLKKTKTGYSTDESVLEQLAVGHDLPALVVQHRRLAKLRSTYIDALPPLVNERTGRIHPTFHQTGAATGRLSSSHPNVQNIPIRSEDGIRIREAFIPAEGRVLLSADYSQVELRILAHFSGDASLRDAFAEGADVHRRTAAEVAGIAEEDVSADQRAAAKAVNFGIIYGLSAFGLAGQLGIATGQAQAMIDAYFGRYLGVRHFLDQTIETARESGYTRTLLGRRRYLPDLGSRNRALRQASERMAVNSVIQGTAADLMKKAMVEVDEGLRTEGLAARMILQVHDELVFDVPDAETGPLEELVRARMEGVYALEVPLVVDVGQGPNWREAH